MKKSFQYLFCFPSTALSTRFPAALGFFVGFLAYITLLLVAILLFLLLRPARQMVTDIGSQEPITSL